MSREETAYTEKLVAINRVAKVVKGGKRFSFSALIIVGDGKGRIGYASGKAREVADAVKKASEKAKRSMVRIPMREGRTLHHDAFGKFGAGKVILRSAVSGTGIIAGGAMRSVFEALGIQDIVSKCIGTTNPHNMVRATFDALQSTVSPKYIASKRNKRVGEVASRRASIK
ncbi:MAG: 30S ribosomal protein S5 [Holosporaceae bacterium]|jgi:small subunit ribosomal protein S5|nr:30S ribosomal protein S5 [Holosporaceae bacterium]